MEGWVAELTAMMDTVDITSPEMQLRAQELLGGLTVPVQLLEIAREQVPSRWHPATTAAPPYRSCGTQQDGLTRCTLAPCAVVWRHFGSCEQHVAAAARIRCRRSGPRPCPPYRRTATRGAQQAAHSDRSGNSSGNCHFPPFPLACWMKRNISMSKTLIV